MSFKGFIDGTREVFSIMSELTSATAQGISTVAKEANHAIDEWHKKAQEKERLIEHKDLREAIAFAAENDINHVWLNNDIQYQWLVKHKQIDGNELYVFDNKSQLLFNYTYKENVYTVLLVYKNPNECHVDIILSVKHKNIAVAPVVEKGMMDYASATNVSSALALKNAKEKYG